MPPPSRQGSSTIIGQKFNEHQESHEESKEDGPNNNNTRKTSGLLTRMTQVFDFKARQSSNQRAETTDPAPAPRLPSNSKRLLWGLKKSTPDLRKTSRGGTFDAMPEMSPQSDKSDTAFGRFTPPPESHLRIPKNRVVRAPTRIPKSVSSTVARVEFSIGARKIQPNQDMETWVTVTVNADVNNVEEAVAANTGRTDVPLDVLILVDNSDEATTDFLQGACKNVFHLASALDTLVDRIAIGCISSDPTHNLDLLMPLGSCNFETIYTTFYSLPSLQRPNQEADGSRLCDALREASNWLLRQSSRGSLRQIFVLTPQSKISITDGCRPELLRLHTISPAPIVDILNSQAFYGWHVCTTFSQDADREAEDLLKQNLKQLVGYLRLGMDPGVLSNLMVNLKTTPGTEVKTCLVNTMRRRLRPGESWSMLFRIVTAGKVRVEEAIKSVNAEQYIDGEYGQEVDVDGMIDEIQGMLGQQETCFENVLAATVEYGHSAYPKDTVLKTTGKCDIAEIPPPDSSDEPAETIQKVEKFEEMDDDSDVDGGILRPRTERGGYHTVKTKKGCFFSRNPDADVAQEDTEQQQQQEERLDANQVHPLHEPEVERHNERASTTTPSGERAGLPSMNPYRALVAKASDMNIHRRSSKALRHG